MKKLKIKMSMGHNYLLQYVMSSAMGPTDRLWRIPENHAYNLEYLRVTVTSLLSNSIRGDPFLTRVILFVSMSCLLRVLLLRYSVTPL